MSDGIFGRILGGSIGCSYDPNAVRNLSKQERAQIDLLRSAAMVQRPAATREALLRNALAMQNAAPRYEGPDLPTPRPTLIARLGRWFFQY